MTYSRRCNSVLTPEISWIWRDGQCGASSDTRDASWMSKEVVDVNLGVDSEWQYYGELRKRTDVESDHCVDKQKEHSDRKKKFWNMRVSVSMKELEVSGIKDRVSFLYDAYDGRVTVKTARERFVKYAKELEVCTTIVVQVADETLSCQYWQTWIKWCRRNYVENSNLNRLERIFSTLPLWDREYVCVTILHRVVILRSSIYGMDIR